MFCHNCGKQIPDGTKFCHYCGAAQNAAPEQPAPAQAVQQAQPQPAAYQPAQMQAQQVPYQAPQAQQPAPTPTDQPAQQPVSGQPAAAPVKERVWAGALGALVFSLPGVLLMFRLYGMDVGVPLSGLVILLCAAGGYALFGKALGKRGVVISVLIALTVIYIANRFYWAGIVRLQISPSASITGFFLHLNNFLNIGKGGVFSTIKQLFYRALARQYAFAAAGVLLLAVKLRRDSRAAKKN